MVRLAQLVTRSHLSPLQLQQIVCAARFCVHGGKAAATGFIPKEI